MGEEETHGIDLSLEIVQVLVESVAVELHAREFVN